MIHAICGVTGASSAGTEMISAGTNTTSATAHRERRAATQRLRAIHRWFAAAVLLLCGIFCARARAQCTPVWSAVGSGTNGNVNALAVLPGGDVIVGGSFSTAGGIPASNIARYNPATGQWSALGSGTDQAPLALSVTRSGDVIVAGLFTTAGGVAANGIARYSPTTGTWSALGSGISGGFVQVNALAVLPTGECLVGGSFTAAGGVAASGVARYNPTTGVWSSLGTAVIGSVYALAVLPGGDCLVGGNLFAVGGDAANRIYRYNPTTGAWSPLGAGFDQPVRVLAVLPNGDFLAGGFFSTVGDVPANRIARYSPTTDAWSALGSGISGGYGVVYALAVLPTGECLVGGSFTTAGDVAANYIAQYNPTTGAWSAVGPGTSGNFVFALAVIPGGDCVVGGSFFSAGNIAANAIARYGSGLLGPSLGFQTPSMATCPGTTAVLSVTAGGAGPLTYQWRKGFSVISAAANPSAATATLVLANVGPADVGSYRCTITNNCGTVTSNPATLTLAAKCSLADIVGTSSTSPGGPVVCGDSTVDGSDFVAFINSFAIGDVAIDPLADVAGAGPDGLQPDGTIDGSDFVAFINAFALGC